jgi:hypothetical protein
MGGSSATGPGSFRVSNEGTGSYSEKSNAVAALIGERVMVSSVFQTGAGAGSTITANGSGFSTLTVINFFNEQSGRRSES